MAQRRWTTWLKQVLGHARSPGVWREYADLLLSRGLTDILHPEPGIAGYGEYEIDVRVAGKCSERVSRGKQARHPIYNQPGDFRGMKKAGPLNK